MLTNSELRDELVRRGFRDYTGRKQHSKIRNRTRPWCYLLGDWGLNYGTSRARWDQVHFTTAAYAAGRPYIDPGEVGTIKLYHGQFTDPGIKVEQCGRGAMVVGGSFEYDKYDGDTAGVLEGLADRIGELVGAAALS